MAVEIITAAGQLPVELESAKAYLKIDEGSEDSTVVDLLGFSTDWFQSVTGRQLIHAQYRQRYGCFAEVMKISRPPLVTVDAVKYLDADGAEQTLATSEYEVNTGSLLGEVHRSYDGEWPAIRGGRWNSISIEFTSGYGAAPGDVDTRAKQAVLLAASLHYHERVPLTLNQVPKALPFALKSIIGQMSVLGFQ